MGNIIIDVEEKDFGKVFVLSGDIKPILDNGRIRLSFKDIGAKFDQADEVTLPFSEESVGTLYTNIERIRKRYNLCSEYKLTEQATQFLRETKEREENFQEFSKQAYNIRNNSFESSDLKDFKNVVEEELERELYELQLLSAYHLAFAQNACNFSVPGAGKTSIVYATYAYLRSLPKEHKRYVNRILIICPLAAFLSWEDEYKECFGKTTDIKKLVGMSARDRANHFIADERAEITLISYQSASSDIAYIRNYLKQHQTMMVLDEAHKIKNANIEAKWSKAILSVAEYAKARVVLTGTPAPNSYADLWNLYKFIWPNKNIIRFPYNYLESLSKSDLSRPDDKKKLTDNIAPFFLRIKKSDLGLPNPIFNNPIPVKMDEQQKSIYDHIETKYITPLELNSNSSFTQQLKKAKLIRLRQCLTNPHLLKKPLDEFEEEEGISGIDDREILQAIKEYQATPEKFIATGKLIKETIFKKSGADGRVIVWAYFIDNIKGLCSYLHSINIPCELLYGDTPNESDETEENNRTRQSIIRRFHDHDNCPYRVIVANPSAVGESISLHKACHNAIYLERDFNAVSYMQSKDRIHRYGLAKDDTINYYDLVTEDSIDQMILERVMEKEQKMLEIIDKEEIPLFNIEEDADADDIRAIIKDYRDRKSAQRV